MSPPRLPRPLPFGLSAKTRAGCPEVHLGRVPGASLAPRPVRFGARVCIRNFLPWRRVPAAARGGWACARAVPGAASRSLIVPGVDE